MSISIIQTDKQCYVCETTYGLHNHHIFFGTGDKKISDDNGFTVWLCGYHHNLSDNGVHFDKSLDTELKKECQRIFEINHTRDEWHQLSKYSFKNYL